MSDSSSEEVGVPVYKNQLVAVSPTEAKFAKYDRKVASRPRSSAVGTTGGLAKGSRCSLGKLTILLALAAASAFVLMWSRKGARLGSQPFDWFRQNPNEITIHRDTRTKDWGFRYSDSLMLSSVNEQSPAYAAGLSEFLSRRITHANDVSVLNADQFHNVESRIGDSLLLRFAPSGFVVGATVKVIERILLKSGAVIEPGSLGTIVRVPGELKGSVATVKSPNFGLWDPTPGQVEPYEESVKLLPGMTVRTKREIFMENGDRVPSGAVGVITNVPGELPGSVAEVNIGRMIWDAMAGQLEIVSEVRAETPPPPPLATKEIVMLLESLGHQQYLPRLVALGLDRLDFLAEASRSDGVALGIRPHHWKRIVMEAKRRVPLSGRGRSALEQLCSDLGEKSLISLLVSIGIDRLDQLALAVPMDGQSLKVAPEKWDRIVEEAKKRMNMTSTNTDLPQTPTQHILYRLLQDVGLVKHYKRLMVFGLDSVSRLAKSANISVTIELDGRSWNRMQGEAKHRLSGKKGNTFAAANPEDDLEADMTEHQRLVHLYDEQDTQNLRAANDKKPSRFDVNLPKRSNGDNVVDILVEKAIEKERTARDRVNEEIKRLGSLGLRGNAF
ncbi:hypothetical protein DIPPA_53610 [Diplonema papillatum]|nr:hypothetical protein DIPPA_53610 [Diplonema papillatum]